MDLCNEPGSSNLPAVFRGKNFNVGQYTQTVQPYLFMPTMLVSTIGLYDFIPLPLNLTFPGGHKVSAKENLLTSFSRTLFT